MAITEKRQPWLYKGGAPQIVNVKIGASQNFIAGSPGVTKTDGQTRLADSFTSAANNACHGFFLAEASTPTEGASVRFARITDDQVWAFYASNSTNDATLSQANVGNVYGMTVQSTSAPARGYATLDVGITLNDSGYGGLLVDDLMANVETTKYSTTDAQGVALCKFQSDVIDRYVTVSS